jgi:hypothetical protein
MNSHWIARTLAGLSAVALIAIAAPAPANDYIEFSPTGGLTVEPSQVKGIDPSWVLVSSYSFGISKPPSKSSGGAARATAIGSLTVTGIRSPALQGQLVQLVLAGTLIASVRLILTKPNRMGEQVATEYNNFRDVYVTSAQNLGTNTDTFDFNFAQYQYEAAAPPGKTATDDWVTTATTSTPLRWTVMKSPHF